MYPGKSNYLIFVIFSDVNQKKYIYKLQPLKLLKYSIFDVIISDVKSPSNCLA